MEKSEGAGFRQVIVLGAGAIGSYYGALLSRGAKVHIIGRRDHVDAINAGGSSSLGPWRAGSS